VNQGFPALENDNPSLQGSHPENICNRGASRTGLQLEIDEGLRNSFFASLTSEGRRQSTKRLQVFADAIRAGITARLKGYSCL